ncbi:MAG: isoprenylcysteine carboxylmethyltransferase family protein [Gammaproteobacteria bacterium]|nr:isoprenylcysteine carboxylmethyltransferase family protein [Gammaproteobacteria bacterium]
MAGLKTRIFARFLALPIVIGLLLLLPAGTFDFWQVYVYVGMILILVFAATSYFLKHDPELVERRLRSREKQDTQKAVMLGMTVIVILMYVIPGLDRRFGWSDVPTVVVLLADFLVAAGYLFIAFVMKTNSYASRIVEVEEGQQVIKTGPYAVVRHPMYTGAVFMYLASPVALGSWWGIVPAIIMPLILIPRILNEERVLRDELTGYSEYCTEVRWRLLPYVW